jgi:HAD superfamily hydrolase (TIGR01509 family)
VSGVRGVLLDSGGVLIGPVGGRWNPRRDFEPTVLAVAPGLTADDLARAIAVGEEYLAAAPATAPRDDYHRVLLDDLGVESTPSLLRELSRPVAAATIVEPFPEVFAVLEEIRHRGIPMAIVSDADAELTDPHIGLGLHDFFDAYAISAVVGCHKPDPRMFRHASDALALRPGECLFVDDDPDLVRAAIELGYHGLALLRPPAETALDVPVITDLIGILDRL